MSTRLHRRYENLNPDESDQKSAVDRRQMVTLDHGTSGCITGGEGGRVAAESLAALVERYERANAQSRARGAVDWAEWLAARAGTMSAAAGAAP